MQFVNVRLDQVPPNPDSVSVSIAGVINFGRAPTIPLHGSGKRYQFENLLSWTKGRHNWRFGASYRPAEFNVYNELLFNGVFLFGGGGPLLVAVPAADRAVLTGPLAPPTSTTLTNLQYFNLGLATGWQQGFGNPLFEGTQHNLGIFAQTSWKPTPRVTVDLGMRVDYDGEPPPLSPNTYVSPRLGFAWDLRGNGRTVIRGGAGTFYAPVLAQIFAAATLQSNKGDHLLIPSRSFADGAQSPTALWAYGMRLGKYPFKGLTEAEIRAFGIIPRPMEPGRRVADASQIMKTHIRFKPASASRNNSGAISRWSCPTRPTAVCTSRSPWRTITARPEHQSSCPEPMRVISSDLVWSGLTLTLRSSYSTAPGETLSTTGWPFR